MRVSKHLPSVRVHFLADKQKEFANVALVYSAH